MVELGVKGINQYLRMDWIYNIVDAASKLIKDKVNTLVLHKSVKQHSKFKVYKIFEYKLYLVNSRNKDKTLILEHSFTRNTPSDDLLNTWIECDKEYLPILIKWFTEKDFISWI